MHQEIVRSHGFDPAEQCMAICKCICVGFFINVAKLGNDCRYAVLICPSSVFHQYGDSSDFILFRDMYDGNCEGIDVRPCSLVSRLWLKQLAPDYLT
ncbi:hypothetical protein ACHAW6_011792 [Cyclotella cf. meneghiniana]